MELYNPSWTYYYCENGNKTILASASDVITISFLVVLVVHDVSSMEGSLFSL